MGIIPRPATSHSRSHLDAERIRTLTVLGLAEHPDVASTRRVSSMYRDRIGLVITDHAGQEFRLHFLIEPRQAVAR